ncbi:MAG: alpha/beta hydrolase [Anaerolineae bacterium]|nr:alpha/beta hydrolase [Anaerolineae bacterium]
MHRVGQGKPLVFVHGLLVNHKTWRKVVAELQNDYECILPDLPLGAHSLPLPPGARPNVYLMADLMGAMLEALDLRDVTLIGNDSGGAISQFVVTRHPARIGKLVLTNCDAFRNFPPPILRPLKWATYVPGFLPLLGASSRLRLGQRILFGLVAKHPVPAEVARDILTPFIQNGAVRRDAGRFMQSIHPRQTQEVAKKLPEFKRPVLLPWGQADPIFPLKFGHKLCAQFPDARPQRAALGRASHKQQQRLLTRVDPFANPDALSIEILAFHKDQRRVAFPGAGPGIQQPDLTLIFGVGAENSPSAGA